MMATIDSPDRKRETAREVAKALREGDTIDRVTMAQFREMPWRNPDCLTHAPKVKKTRSAAPAPAADGEAS